MTKLKKGLFLAANASLVMSLAMFAFFLTYDHVMAFTIQNDVAGLRAPLGCDPMENGCCREGYNTTYLPQCGPGEPEEGTLFCGLRSFCTYPKPPVGIFVLFFLTLTAAFVALSWVVKPGK